MTECTGAKRKAEIARKIEDVYRSRHRIKHGYYNHVVNVDRMGSDWHRYRRWVSRWIDICRAARGLGSSIE